jgi:predicted ABC-type ATPase
LKPTLFIITGSNGAGKSTVGASYLPVEIQDNYNFFDGDKLSLAKRKELLPLIKSLKEARKQADEWMYDLFVDKVKKAIKTNDHFAYEGHFRDKQTLQTPKKFKKKGYYLSLIFMGLPDPHQSELRVIDRAKYGGHNVPLYEIESNFYGNLIMLNKNLKLFDEITVVDTSKHMQHKVLLHMRHFSILSYTPLKEQPDWFTRFLPNLSKLIKIEEKR